MSENLRLKMFAVFSSLFASAAKADPTITTLVAFNGIDGNGAYSTASLVADASGNLYGTTQNGGPQGWGTVFEVAAGTHAFSTLVTFANGGDPRSGLIVDSAGNLYGTTYGNPNGPAYANGTVYEVQANTHQLVTLATLNGQFPVGGLVADSAGNMYGTTYQAAGSYGTVFEVSAGTHMLSTLATFNMSNGAFPYAGLVIDAAGNLYGTTETGGSGNDGTVFEVSAGTHALGTLATFNGTNGSRPESSLTLDASGNLYGTTYYGSIFKVAAGTHALTTLASVGNANQFGLFGGLIEDAAGNLYGTTAYNYGTLFEYSAATQTASTLLAFNGATGIEPQDTLIADASGDLYGTTYYAGPAGWGTVFELSGTGFVVVPEPGGLGLAGAGCLCLYRCRRRRASSL